MSRRTRLTTGRRACDVGWLSVSARPFRSSHPRCIPGGPFPLMTRPLAAVAVAVGMVAAVAAWAETPKFTSIGPLGARRGEATEVTVFGSNLEGKARLIAPFSAEVETLGADPASWKVKITPAADTPVGVYACRIRTDDGLTAPFLFAVGQVPQVQEKEENGTFDLAQPIPSPVVVEGKSEGNDVDFFRFPGKKGQRIVIDAQCSRIGSGVDPSIRLTTAAHAYVASADDTPGLMTDRSARDRRSLPEDTDYTSSSCPTPAIQGHRQGHLSAARSAPVPVVDEVFPLGGRKGETIGLELKGGTLPGPSIASATLTPNPDADPNAYLPPPRMDEPHPGHRRVPGQIPVLDVGVRSRRLVVDHLARAPRTGLEPGSPTPQGPRAGGLQRADRQEGGGRQVRRRRDPRPEAPDRGRRRRARLGARRRPPGQGARRRRARQRRRLTGEGPGQGQGQGQEGRRAQLARPLARLHRPRRDDRAHPHPPRPPGRRRGRLPLPPDRRADRPDLVRGQALRGPVEHPERRDRRDLRDRDPAGLRWPDHP